MDCLIISYSEPNRSRERGQFFKEESRKSGGWGRFLHSNYIDYNNDIMLPNHMASIAKLTRANEGPRKSQEGFYNESDISTYSCWKIPLLGGMYLYQYLKGLDFDVRVIQHVQMESESFDNYLSQSPKVIAISTTLLLNPLDIAQLVKYCREKSPDSFIVLGGMSIWNAYLANQDNPDIFKTYRADAVIVDAKGFKTLGKIVETVRQSKSIFDVPNVIAFQNGKVQITNRFEERYDFRKDAINWDLIEDHLLGKIFLLRTQISCPFSCSFCNYPTSQGEVLKSELGVLEEELKILQNRGVNYLLFVDDTFNVPMRRFIEILNILKKYDFKWYAFIRCQYLDKRQVILMKQSGCQGVFLGIESANKEILKAMNKRATPGEYMRGVALLQSQNITSYASFIVGFPGETQDAVVDTRNFIETSGIDFYNVKIFYYDPTTPIALKNKEYGLTGQGMNWQHNTMNSRQAFDYMEDIIKGITKVPYIPQYSGEIWEIAYFHEQGFSPLNVHTLYNNFTKMLQDELTDNPQKQANQNRLFKELIQFC